MNPSLFRIRVLWRKKGRLAYLSHLEIARALERIVRRAKLPYALSQGFNPHMRIAFGAALPVGTGGDEEFFDVWLTEYVRPDSVLESLRANAPADLEMVEAVYIAPNAASLSAVLTIAEYVIELEGSEADADSFETSIAEALESGEVVIEHKGKERRYDLGEAFAKPPVVEYAHGRVRTWFTIRSTAGGTLRAERFLWAVIGDRVGEARIRRAHRTRQYSEDGTGRMLDGFGREVE